MDQDKLISVARGEIGYREKATNSQLDDKTANAGSGNYNKYSRYIDVNYPNWMNGPKNGYSWCAMFVCWCFLQAFGYDKARELLCMPEHSLGASCTAGANYFNNKGQFYKSNPKPGDTIYFGNSLSDCEHIGIVEKVEGSTVYTIEGNADNQVKRCSYSLNSGRIVGYGRPNYDTADNTAPAKEPTSSTPVATTTVKGIDIYSGTGKVDFNKVKSAGYSFAIIRAGYGRYINQKDERFEEHYAGAKAAGLNVGAYWFSYATTIEQAEMEADVCIQVLRGKQFEYPIFFDIETQAAFNTGKSNVSAMIMAFGKKLESAGYYTGLYNSTYYLTNYVSDEVKRKFTLWVAQYASSCTYSGAGRVDMWQKSESGSVPGCAGNTDLDECYYDYPAAIKAKGLNGFKASAKPAEPTPSAPQEPVDPPKPVDDTPQAPSTDLSSVKGDVDLDGKVTASDARTILRVSAGLGALEGQALKNADMNDDGKITAEDARAALRKSANLDE